ncbi:hypothetical protein ABIQ69_17005 [Agromyces sp. G08B096]|uniref:DUF3618 domain-containing protein n=1 Tax=Agromyces sp. G08B096 TaxID=3156399 RepID=A0AAU7W7X3_9MICO
MIDPNPTTTTSGTTGSDAGDAARHVADTAKRETASVAAEAKDQVRSFAGRVRDEVRSQASTQQSRAADGLRSTASSFTTMADAPDASGIGPQLARAAGERVERAADWLGTREPGDVVDEVKAFARRRPGVFIAIAVGAGVVVGRLVRALSTQADTPSTGGRP